MVLIYIIYEIIIISQLSLLINKDMWMFVDIPILDGATPITMNTAATWKATNGYTKQNETVYFPMAAAKLWEMFL